MNPSKASVPRRCSRGVWIWALALWLLAAAAVLGGSWIAVQKPMGPAPSHYYIVQWVQTANCSVETALPSWGQYRVLWQASDRETALRKLAGFEHTFRCL